MPDAPQLRGAAAFGALPPEQQAKRFVTISAYQLGTGLPTAPPTLNVFIAGGYPDSDIGRAAIFGEPGWQFVPSFPLVQYTGADPLGSPGPAATDADALAR